jgi:membrane protein YqaA with SNARE-associated domain
MIRRKKRFPLFSSQNYVTLNGGVFKTLSLIVKLLIVVFISIDFIGLFARFFLLLLFSKEGNNYISRIVIDF